MRWKVRITGDESGLEELVKSFDDDPKVFEEEGNHYIWSSSFEDADDVDEIREISEDLVRVIRNFGKRDSIKVGNLEASHVNEILEDGTTNTYVKAETAVATVSTTAAAVVTDEKGIVEEYLPADRTYEWTQLASEDQKLLELAKLLDNGDHWVNLYRIYEFIQANIKDDDNIVDQGWWSESEKDIFKRTANSREAIGDDARHGQDRIPAPEEPMSHSEAKRLVDTLIDHWLHHRKNISE